MPDMPQNLDMLMSIDEIRRGAEPVAKFVELARNLFL